MRPASLGMAIVSLFFFAYASLLWGVMRTASQMKILPHNRAAERASLADLRSELTRFLASACDTGTSTVFISERDVLADAVVLDPSLRRCNIIRETDVTPFRRDQMNCRGSLFVLDAVPPSKAQTVEPALEDATGDWQPYFTWKDAGNRYQFRIFKHPDENAFPSCAAVGEVGK